MTCQWSFRQLDQKESRQGDIPTKHAFDSDLETFVREVLQNSNDAGVDDETVEVTFRFQRLRSDRLKQFEDTFQWEEQLESHLRAAAEEEQDLSLHQFLDGESGEREELVLLTIEDRNTVGLEGEEDADDSKYTALVRDMHRSDKEGSQGGSHGVGGTVLWAFSGISTVLFTSNPADSDRPNPRFVGRSYLPDHTVADTLYKGYGWYGVEDPDDPDGRNISAWGDEATAVADQLGVTRPSVSGTSITIVGFREPGESQPNEERLEKLIDDVRTAAVENFWPAIRRGDLEVAVEGPDDDEPRPADLDSHPQVMPFVEAYEALYQEDDPLGHPGNTASTEVDFDFPERSDGTETPDRGEVSLSVRTADPSEEELRNHIAVFRGSGMVVDYVDASDEASYGADFHGVLACGEARTELGEEDDPVDEAVERLVRIAEPAAHDEWTGTPRLKNEYKGRRVGLVEDLQGSLLRDEVRELVSEDDDDSGDPFDGFQELFPVGMAGGGGGGDDDDDDGVPSPFQRKLHELSFEGDHWVFEVTLEHSSESKVWEAAVGLDQRLETKHGGEQIDVESFEVLEAPPDTESRLDDGRVVVDTSSPGSVRLRCVSEETGEPEPTTGRSGRTGVRHELREEVST